MLSKNQVKYLHSLRLGKFRDIYREFLAEGIKLVDDLLNSHFEVKYIYATGSWLKTHDQKIADKDIVIREVTSEELEKVSNLVTPNEVLAVVGIPEPTVPAPDTLGKLVLVLDRIQDPGNLGTIIRTADWFGIRHIFCSAGTVDLFNPKVVQSTMGSICRVHVHYTDLHHLLANLGETWQIYGTVPAGENIYKAELEFPAAIIIGNESKGIAEEYFSLFTSRIGIPSMSDGAESLNAPVAAGIIVSEFCRRQLLI
jgi:RNA methyltransferase, TrmH family